MCIHQRTSLMMLLAFSLSNSAQAVEIEALRIEPAAKTIYISGMNFGQGPNIQIFDTFENPDRAVDSPISLNASVIGNWSSLNPNYTPTYGDVARTGQKSVVAVSSTGMQQFRKELGAIQEIFVSYWMRLDGDYFPGDLVSGPRSFSDDSSFKFAWLYDTDVKGQSADVCLPTHVGRGNFYIAGNSSNLVTGIGNDWWSWDNWMRISFWIKANESNPIQPGTVFFETVSADKGYSNNMYSVPIFTDNGVEPKVYRNINFPGWVRSMNNNTRILYDDIYIATGENSATRVELGNAAELSKVTRLDLLHVVSWEPSKIQVTHPTVTETELKGMYLYITNGQGETNQEGFPLFARPSTIDRIEIF